MQPAVPEKQKTYERLKAWIHKHPSRTYAIIVIGLAIAGSMSAAAIFWQRPEEVKVTASEPKAVSVPRPDPIYSPLTGEPVADESATNKPVTAIMVENSPDARPQSGLKDAEIVYEAVAEGGITRFLALYQQNQPQTIGPVRSLRMYYVDWLTPYNASVAHVGGSAAALKLIRNGQYRDIDQFFHGAYYRRVSDRYAPHNVYTSFAKLNELNAAKGYVTSKPQSFERADDQPATQDATTVNLKISGPTYNPTYVYDPGTKRYNRFQAGAPHVDREAGQIQAKVVIAMKVTMQRVFEDGYRESIATVGSGEAMVFQNGHATAATWHKESRDAQLRFTETTTGQPLTLARGITWISAVPSNEGNITWQ